MKILVALLILMNIVMAILAWIAGEPTYYSAICGWASALLLLFISRGR